LRPTPWLGPKAVPGGIQMIMRMTILVASLLATASAIAEPMGPEVAQRFVTGKLFAFNCVDGTRGPWPDLYRWLGNGDDSGQRIRTGTNVRVSAGHAQGEGRGRMRHSQRPVFEPCFNLNRTGEQSFRGSLTGLGGFAYCDFVRRVSSASVKEQQAH